MLSRVFFPVLGAAAFAGACQDAPQVAPSGETRVEVTSIAKGLDHPWSLAFLPDGRMLVTERPGRLRYVSREGALSQPITVLLFSRSFDTSGEKSESPLMMTKVSTCSFV